MSIPLLLSCLQVSFGCRAALFFIYSVFPFRKAILFLPTLNVLFCLSSQLCMLDAEKDGEKSNNMWLDLSDEDSCNWMMFVRPAQNHLEQNLVAYQYGSEIFYTTIKNIQPKQELKVSPLCCAHSTLIHPINGTVYLYIHKASSHLCTLPS